MTISKELRKSFGNFFMGVASFVTTAIIAKPMLLGTDNNDKDNYAVATIVVLVCLLLGALLLQTVKENNEMSTKNSKGKRIFKFHKNTTFSVEELSE